MKNLELLLKHVKKENHMFLSINKMVIKGIKGNQCTYLCGIDIYKLMEQIKWNASHLENNNFVIEIQSNAFTSTDVVNVLEIIMLYLATFFPNHYTIIFTKDNKLKNNIYYKNSILPDFNGKPLATSFTKRFHEKGHITLNHYRELLTWSDYQNNKTLISSISTNIYMFLQHSNYYMDDKTVDEVVEICSELIDNTFQHSDGDCLLDIKISRNANAKIFFSINVISLTDIFIQTKLMNIIEHKLFSRFSGGKIVKKAFKKHKKYLSDSYRVDSFSLVSAFQNTVSTREDRKDSGGTGFTTMLRNIHSKSLSNEYNSYVISGDLCLFFKNEFIMPTKNGTIGFNKENNYLKYKPDESILLIENNVFPGTIFSINLVI